MIEYDQGRSGMSICTHCTNEQLSLSTKLIEEKLESFFLKNQLESYDCHLFLQKDLSGYSAIVELLILDGRRCEMKAYGKSVSELCSDLVKRLERRIEKMLRNHASYRDRLRAPASSASAWFANKHQPNSIAL